VHGPGLYLSSGRNRDRYPVSAYIEEEPGTIIFATFPELILQESYLQSATLIGRKKRTTLRIVFALFNTCIYLQQIGFQEIHRRSRQHHNILKQIEFQDSYRLPAKDFKMKEKTTLRIVFDFGFLIFGFLILDEGTLFFRTDSDEGTNLQSTFESFCTKLENCCSIYQIPASYITTRCLKIGFYFVLFYCIFCLILFPHTYSNGFFNSLLDSFNLSLSTYIAIKLDTLLTK
jgi:hypothetical protein